MVVIPAGKAMIGSPLGESGRQTFEAAPHPVEIAKPFAMGHYDVTFAQWDACFAEGACGRRHLGDLEFGRGARPAMFMNWNEVEAFAQHPLVSVGAHSLTHRRLALWPEENARDEMVRSKAILESRLARSVNSFCYPVGDSSSAGAREFRLAREAGFTSAVTTRPGMLFREHAEHMTALPRVSLNGLWQDRGYLDVLLSGAPFAIWNRGRRLNVA